MTNSLLSDYKEWAQQGIRFHKCYVDDWDEIKTTFKILDIDLLEHGPIITINELKNVKTAYKVMMQIKDNPKVRSIVSEDIVDTKTQKDYEIAIRGKIFLYLLRAIPEYCRSVAIEQFNEFISNGNSEPFLKDLFSVSGTLKNMDIKVDEIIHKVLKEEQG